MKSNCARCQRDIEISGNIFLMQFKTHQYICPDCIISQFPKTFKHDHIHPKNNTERRHTQRHPLVCQVHLINQDDEKSDNQAIILDVSETGMRLQLTKAQSLWKQITVEFAGQKLVYRLIGEVVRHRFFIRNTQRFYELGIRILSVQHHKREELP